MWLMCCNFMIYMKQWSADNWLLALRLQFHLTRHIHWTEEATAAALHLHILMLQLSQSVNNNGEKKKDGFGWTLHTHHILPVIDLSDYTSAAQWINMIDIFFVSFIFDFFISLHKFLFTEFLVCNLNKKRIIFVKFLNRYKMIATMI